MHRGPRQQVGGGWQGVRALGLCIDDKSQHLWVTGPDGPVPALHPAKDARRTSACARTSAPACGAREQWR